MEKMSKLAREALEQQRALDEATEARDTLVLRALERHREVHRGLVSKLMRPNFHREYRPLLRRLQEVSRGKGITSVLEGVESSYWRLNGWQFTHGPLRVLRVTEEGVFFTAQSHRDHYLIREPLTNHQYFIPLEDLSACHREVAKRARRTLLEAQIGFIREPLKEAQSRSRTLKMLEGEVKRLEAQGKEKQLAKQLSYMERSRQRLEELNLPYLEREMARLQCLLENAQ